MEKQRKYKVFSIIALLFAVVGLSVGFAAFQKVLNISSSAEVKLPSEDDLKLTLYGFIDVSEFDKFYDNKKLDFLKWSKDKVYAWDVDTQSFNLNYSADINSSDFIVDINSLKFVNPGDNYIYVVALQNDSNYGVYVYLSEESRAKFGSGLYGWSANCVADEGTTQELMRNVCDDIEIRFQVGDIKSDNKTKIFLNGNYKLEAGEYMFFYFNPYYNGTDRVDGNVFVEFDPIKIDFDTLPHTYENLNIISEEDA